MATVTTPQDILVAGLRNAHAMESQALSIMRPQLDRLENYPDVSDMLDRHIRETEGQLERLEQILQSQDEGASGLKDLALSFTGSMAALGHSMAPDEILKNAMANFAFENFEIAAYTSLIAVARLSGAPGSAAIPLLEQNLAEERRMAGWLSDNMAAVTERYVTLSSAGEQAGI